MKINEGKYNIISEDLKSTEIDLKVKMADCEIIQRTQMENGLMEDGMDNGYNGEASRPLMEDEDRNFNVIFFVIFPL